MALGKEVGEFSYKITSVRHAKDDGTLVEVTCDGTATGYGTVLGTLIFESAPGAQDGTITFRAQGFLEGGVVVDGLGIGTFESSGTHKWRVRAVNKVSDGQTFASDGQLDLATRSFSGKLIEWT